MFCTVKHVSQIRNSSVAEVNRLLGAVVDVENIFMSMHREDDQDTKRVYYYLFKVPPIQHKFKNKILKSLFSHFSVTRGKL